MPYPFSNNPLDTYLHELRALKAEEYFLYRSLPGTPSLEKVKLLKKIGSVQEQLQQKKCDCLPPRTFDVFLSENELKIIDFDSKNPRPIFKVCDHDKCESRIKIFSNKTKHIWVQCTSCGKCCGTRKKGDCSGWESYPQYDEKKEYEFNEEYFEWNKKRTGLFLSLWSFRDEMPSFDEAAFSAEYKNENPEPIHPDDCLHQSTKNTFRLYKDGKSAIVEQCIICGKHVKSLPKRLFKNFEELEKFDEDSEGVTRGNRSEWYFNYSQSLNIARQAFHEDISRQVAAGMIIPVDKSKFGTYYDSEQWQKTRQRIFMRDDYICQSCGFKAECVHHITYERLGCENDLDLISLCNLCHDLVHLKQNEYPFPYKLSPSEIRCVMEGEDEK